MTWSCASCRVACEHVPLMGGCGARLHGHRIRCRGKETGRGSSRGSSTGSWKIPDGMPGRREAVRPMMIDVVLEGWTTTDARRGAAVACSWDPTRGAAPLRNPLANALNEPQEPADRGGSGPCG